MAPLDLLDMVAWLRTVAPNGQLSSDSRAIAAGDVFFAYAADEGDGRNFIEDAIERGAVAVVYESAAPFVWNPSWAVACRAIPDLQDHAGPIARAWYEDPGAALFTVAVTGTNGKTSCSQWLGSALSRHCGPTLVIGTLGVVLYKRGIAGIPEATGYTTPDAVMLQRKLAAGRAAGATALAIEASSIGLDQGRMNGLHVDVALFTNLSRDHLDYHGDMQEYESAKTALFDWPGLQHAVINLDDPMGLRLVDRLRQHRPEVGLLGYSTKGQAVADVAVLHAAAIRSIPDGTGFQVNSSGESAMLKTRLIGEFNVSNVLAVVGALLAKGLNWADAMRAVEALEPAAGRMQQLGGNDAPLVVIDYAHTPDALEKTLTALRQVADQRAGKLWCVFGCGGDRDAGKRGEMGLVSALADRTVVTSDNPRTENAAAIMGQIVAGLVQSNKDATARQVIEDRAAAILWAVKHAARADVVLLAGKGHENTQELNGRKVPFLDADHALLALAARATMRGLA